MREIEKHNPQLAGVLPKTYNLFTSTLLKELLKKVSEIPATVDYDAFGRIYEYFLGEFARTEGQKGGEFYTPSSIVKRAHRDHRALSRPHPRSRVRLGRHVRAVGALRRRAPEESAGELAIYGVEKTDETGRLCRLNLAVHGLEGDIRHGGNVNSYYDDPHKRDRSVRLRPRNAVMDRASDHSPLELRLPFRTQHHPERVDAEDRPKRKANEIEHPEHNRQRTRPRLERE